MIYVVSWIPEASRPKNDGWKSASGARNLVEIRLELTKGMPECLPLVTNGNNLTIRKLIALFECRRLRGRLHLLLEVEGDIAQLLFDVSDNFALRRRREGVATFGEVLDEKVRDITSSEVQA